MSGPNEVNNPFQISYKITNMKRSVVLSLLLCFSLMTFSQQNMEPTISHSKEDYLKKSKTQRIIAFSLLGGGAITWLAGASKNMNQNDNIDGGGETAMVVGVIAVVTSIPFFIMASKNKKKAKMATSISLINQRIYFRQNRSYAAVPSLSVKFHF